MTKQLKELDAPAFPLESFSYAESAWQRFDPGAIAKVLSDRREPYYGLKPILFAGFCGWVIDPKGPLRRKAMTWAALECLVKGEKRTKNDFAKMGMAVDLIARYRTIGLHFFEEIYYPMGGAYAFMRGPSQSGLHRMIRARLNAVKTLELLMETIHFVAVEIEPNNGRKPSINGFIRMRENTEKSKTNKTKEKNQHNDKENFDINTPNRVNNPTILQGRSI